jgi:fructuronate reductase
LVSHDGVPGGGVSDLRLSLGVLGRLPAPVRRPGFDPAALAIGQVHLGLGAFHRAHQAVFTEDAIEAEGGDWGVCAISLRTPDAARALASQDGLYTVEIRGRSVEHRVIGCIRQTIAASEDQLSALRSLSAPAVKVVSLTVTEKGYALDGEGRLDFDHPDVAHDLRQMSARRSTVGWLTAGLAARRARGGGAVSIVSCDNLSRNGSRLRAATLAFAEALDPALAAWIADHAAFPATMVDSITPASTPELAARARAALGFADVGCVQREAFSQWVVEDAFAGPRPAWEAAGAELVSDVEPYERLKLHVLNASHSALAYLGLPRGHALVREAVADAELIGQVEAMVLQEIAPALPGLAAADYWRRTRERFANPNIDHRLAQISDDGSQKLAQRVYPILIANARAGRPAGRLASVARAWLERGAQGLLKDPQAQRLIEWGRAGRDLAAGLDDPQLFPPAFREDEAVRRTVLGQ